MKLLETQLTEWRQIFELNRYFLSPFIFRGQANSQWFLETSIERAVVHHSKFSMGLMFGYETEEKWMLYEFKKKYPLYSNHLPKQNDNFEWLAIMQHHGAPTRLLDFTESLFIATYFSVIETTLTSSIWCINRNLLRELLHERFKLNYQKGVQLRDEINNVHIELANSFIAKSEKFKDDTYLTSVIPLEPNIYTERLSKQQGLFLMPTISRLSFFDNLLSAFDLSAVRHFERTEFSELIKYSNTVKLDNKICILKIEIPKEIHRDVHASLKEMNITAENLFPGVDGLAKSLVLSHIQT